MHLDFLERKGVSSTPILSFAAATASSFAASSSASLSAATSSTTNAVARWVPPLSEIPPTGEMTRFRVSDSLSEAALLPDLAYPF